MKKLRGLGKLASLLEFCHYMTGYCDGFDDLSDGAWQSCCENAVEEFNRVHHTNIDPHEGWMYWCKWKSAIDAARKP